MRRLDDEKIVTKIYSRNERRRLKEQWEAAKMEERMRKPLDSDTGSDQEAVGYGKSRFRRRKGSGGDGNGIV